jgi:hypothetical protein
VEIFYSAIDRPKINTIRENIAGMQSGFHYHENSTMRVFSMVREITKETFASVRAELQPIAERIAAVNIYGFINMYIGADSFRQFLCIDVHPLAIPENEVQNFSLALCGLSLEDWLNRKVIFNTEQQKDKDRRDLERKEYERAQSEKRERLQKELAEIFQPQISHLKDSDNIEAGTLVKIMQSIDGKHVFQYYRLAGKVGAFGRVVYEYAQSIAFVSPSGLEFKPGKKQMSVKELRQLKLRGCKLVS